MVVQKALNNLKEGSKEDKTAVAGGIAVSVVVVLLAGWALYFFHNIQKGTQKVQLGGGAQDQFNFTNVTEAQKQLQQELGQPQQDFQDIQKESSQGGNGQMQSQEMQTQGVGTNPFVAPNPGQ